MKPPLERYSPAGAFPATQPAVDGIVPGNLRRCRLSDRASVAAYQGLSRFLSGHLLLGVARQGAGIGPIDDPAASTHVADGISRPCLAYGTFTT